ncbi:recombinase family protein [Paenibacillus sp. FSL F4-0125]|uniref:recombinase family protein n=1 Tax=Paenibacillus sp. FSL F4-0125 TaxID=2954730 RepID=UPI0030FAF7A3
MTDIEKGKRTAIYVRVSTTKASQKDSPEHQEAVCREKARQMDLEIIEGNVYEDRDTGTNIINRPAIQQLVNDAKKRRFDVIIFAALSRFSRDSLDSLSLKRIIVDTLGIRLISIDEGYDSLYNNDELKFQIISAVNQKMSEQTSFSSRRGLRQSALKGNFIGSIAPYGYKKIVIDDKKTLVPEEDTKEIVQLIFQLYTAHKLGEKEIVNFLNEVKKVKSPKGGFWGVTSIQRILQNEAYTGVNVFGKYESIVVYSSTEYLSDRSKKLVQRDKSKWEKAHDSQTHEAIISKEIFILAQELRLKRGGGKRGGIRNNKNLFSGIIQCAHCGSAMVTMKSKSRSNSKAGKEYRYLICSKRRRQGNVGCNNAFWLPYHPFKEDLLTSISDQIGDISSVELLFNKYKDLINVDQKENEKKITKLEKQIASNRTMLFQLRKDKTLGEIDEKQYSYEKKQFESELLELEYQLEEYCKDVEKKNDLQELYDEIKDSLDDLLTLNFDDEEEFEELKSIIKKLIHKITVDREGNISVKTTFGLQLAETSIVENEIAAGKQ